MADTPRKRRWPTILAIVLALLAMAGLWVNYQLEANRLARTALSALGESQGLDISFDGQASYALRPEPRLVLPNVVVSRPGAESPVLTAERVEVSLPWDTIWGGDDKVVITRIELDEPRLDLAALADWRASRPAAPFELPTLTKGLQVSNGRLAGDGWRLEALMLDLPELRPGQALQADVAGRLEREQLAVEFDGALSMQRAGLASPFELQAKGRLHRDTLNAPWSLDLAGAFDATGEIIQLQLESLAFESQSPLPSFQASGSAGLGEPTHFDLQGTMPQWPQDWPQLPEPAAKAERPLDFELAYAGPSDLSEPLSLEMTRGKTRLDANLVIAEVQAWLANEERTPLPPMQGTFSAPSLEIEGFTLENVRAEIVEPAPASEE